MRDLTRSIHLRHKWASDITICSLGGFFYFLLTIYTEYDIQQLIFTRRSCWFLLEKLNSNTSKFIDLLRHFLNPTTFHACIAKLNDLKFPATVHATHIPINIATTVYVMWARLKKQESVLYGADDCVCQACRAPSLTPQTDETHTKMLMTQGLPCQLAGAHHNIYTLKKKNMSLFISIYCFTWSKHTHTELKPNFKRK